MCGSIRFTSYNFSNLIVLELTSSSCMMMFGFDKQRKHNEDGLDEDHKGALINLDCHCNKNVCKIGYRHAYSIILIELTFEKACIYQRFILYTGYVALVSYFCQTLNRFSIQSLQNVGVIILPCHTSKFYWIASQSRVQARVVKYAICSNT